MTQIEKIQLRHPDGKLTDEAEKCIQKLKAQRPAVLAGSGVSLFSDIPSGQEITNGILKVLFWDWNEFRPTDSETNLLRRLVGTTYDQRLSGIPFEHLMDNCPTERGGDKFINECCELQQPNAIHKALAGSLRNGAISSLITTNYDLGLDYALAQVPFTYSRVISASDAKAAHDSFGPTYFKLHGTLGGDSSVNPMYSLKHERLMDPSKRALLVKLLSAAPLVTIGYSGLDFEICPEIERVNIPLLIWNSLSDRLSMSAKRLIEGKNGTVLIGDMVYLLKHWLEADISVTRPAAKVEQVCELVRRVFSEKELNQWRMNTLNALGVPKLTFKAVSASVNFPIDRASEQIVIGRAHFHEGRYKKARKAFARAFRKRLREGHFDKAADSALEMSDAYRSHGAPFTAYACTGVARILDLGALQAKILLKQSLVLRDLSTLAIRMSKRLCNLIKEAARRKLVRCARLALSDGNWIDFQQVALLSIQTEVDISAIADDENYLPPPAAEGYKHLGYYIPQVMIFTENHLHRREELIIDSAMLAEWQHHREICQIGGINSALWKLLAIHPSESTKSDVLTSFNACEYRFFKRRLDWRKYSGRWMF